MRDPALARAIHSAGGLAGLAEALAITKQAVSQWQRCPAERLVDVERASGVPREELRPDLYRVDPTNNPDSRM